MDIDPHSPPVRVLTPSGTTNSNLNVLTPTSPGPDFDMIDLSSLAPPASDVPHLTQSGRPQREYRLPQRFRDNLPEPPTPAPILELQESNPRQRVLLIVRDRFTTASNSFGIWRVYPD